MLWMRILKMLCTIALQLFPIDEFELINEISDLYSNKLQGNGKQIKIRQKKQRYSKFRIKNYICIAITGFI